MSALTPYSLLDFMFEYYEMPLYHPALRYGIKRKLWDWAKKEDLAEVMQGYIDIAKGILRNYEMLQNPTNRRRV